jgi:hypothetical protein
MAFTLITGGKDRAAKFLADLPPVFPDINDQGCRFFEHPDELELEDVERLLSQIPESLWIGKYGEDGYGGPGATASDRPFWKILSYYTLNDHVFTETTAEFQPMFVKKNGVRQFPTYEVTASAFFYRIPESLVLEMRFPSIEQQFTERERRTPWENGGLQEPPDLLRFSRLVRVQGHIMEFVSVPTPKMPPLEHVMNHYSNLAPLEDAMTLTFGEEGEELTNLAHLLNKAKERQTSIREAILRIEDLNGERRFRLVKDDHTVKMMHGCFTHVASTVQSIAADYMAMLGAENNYRGLGFSCTGYEGILYNGREALKAMLKKPEQFK